MSDTYSNAWLVAIVNDDTMVCDSDHIWVYQTAVCGCGFTLLLPVFYLLVRGKSHSAIMLTT